MRFGMIADDITGACDAGVQFAARGFESQVWVNPDAVPGSAEMTVVSTNTRKESPEHARARVGEACEAFARDGVEPIYKKIDSTLAGNIAVEIEAMLAACGFDEAWVAPAFPAMGRTVTDGWLSVAGRKGTVHLPELLAGQGASERVRAFDAATQADLAAIVEKALASPKRVLLAGSAGLAIELANALAAEFGRHPKAPKAARAEGPVLFLIGSQNPVTAAQVAFLLRRRDAVEGIPFAGDALAFGSHAVVNVDWSAGGIDCLPALLRSARGLVLSGGDTARLACWVLKAAGIRLDRELLTGIPCGALCSGPFDGMPVATKAGGFGREDALAVIADTLP